MTANTTFVPEAVEGKLLPELLPWIMLSERFTKHSVQESKGSTNPYINFPDIAKFEFDLPSLDQQRRIANIFWAVDGIEQAHQSAVIAVVLSERAYFTKCFGELSEFITSGSRGWAKHYREQGPLFLRSQNIRDQVLDFADIQRVKPPDGAEGERTRTHAGDIVITITGNSVGNVAYVPDTLEQAYVSQHVGLVRLKEPDRHRMISAFFGKNGPGNDQILKAQYGLKPV